MAGVALDVTGVAVTEAEAEAEAERPGVAREGDEDLRLCSSSD